MLKSAPNRRFSSLLDDDDDDEADVEDLADLAREAPAEPFDADSLFLPPTCLKRSSPIVMSFPQLLKNTMLLSSREGSQNSSSSSSSTSLVRPPTPSFSVVAAMSSRRRFTIARNNRMPVV